MKKRMVTWLPLQSWADFFGINPLYFNQLTSSHFAGESCSEVWYEYKWQSGGAVSRVELSRAIYTAEQKLRDYLHYNLLPDWESPEKVIIPKPARPDVFAGNSLNIRGQAKSIELDLGHFIAAGVKTKQTLVEGLAFTRSDEDSDGYYETCTATYETDVTSACEIRAYYPGQSGADEYEIRPIKVTIDTDTNIATIVFNSWQVVKPELFEQHPGEAIDADEDTNYLTTIDLFRIYNDTTTQGTLIYEPVGYEGLCLDDVDACDVATGTACVQIRDREMGIARYVPAVYDAETDSWGRSDSVYNRNADRIDVYYLSGHRWDKAQCPMVEMDPYWEDVVCKFSAALLETSVCSCNNIETQIDEYRYDIARVKEGTSFQASTEKQINNPFGTRVGAIYAWNAVSAPGRALPK